MSSICKCVTKMHKNNSKSPNNNVCPTSALAQWNNSYSGHQPYTPSRSLSQSDHNSNSRVYTTVTVGAGVGKRVQQRVLGSSP